MFFVLYGPNPPYEFQINWCKRSSVIERKPNSRLLPWRPYWKSYDIHFQKRFFSLIGPIHPVNLKSISASVLLLLSGNQIQDGCHSGHIGKVTTPIFIRVLLQSTLWISNWSVQAFSCYWTKTKFKMAAMAAILEKLRHPLSKGFLPYMVSIHPMHFKLIRASVLLLYGNQIQDGCHGGHIG